LVPVRKQPGLKAGAFSPVLLVPVTTTETNGLYKPGLKALFPPMWLGVRFRSGTGGTRPSINMEVISSDVEWYMPKHDRAFTQACSLGIEVERAGRGACAFADTTKLTEEAWHPSLVSY
jgi:hypothetical protein